MRRKTLPPPSGLHITTRQDGTAQRIVATGELDSTTDRKLRESLVPATAAAAVELDLNGITFMGCTTLKVLFEAHARRRHPFSVCAAPPRVRRLLCIAKLDHLLVQ